jgi:hypothetical protein
MEETQAVDTASAADVNDVEVWPLVSRAWFPRLGAEVANIASRTCFTIPRNGGLASEPGQRDEFEEGKPLMTNSFEQPLVLVYSNKLK